MFTRPARPGVAAKSWRSLGVREEVLQRGVGREKVLGTESSQAPSPGLEQCCQVNSIFYVVDNRQRNGSLDCTCVDRGERRLQLNRWWQGDRDETDNCGCVYGREGPETNEATKLTSFMIIRRSDRLDSLDIARPRGA